MTIVRAPRRSTAWAIAEPAPPAPSSTTRDRSAPGSARRKPQAQPEPSVLWPTARPWPKHHGVDCTHRRRLVGQRVKQRDHRLLARVGDVEAGEVHHARGIDEARQRSRAVGAAVEIDQLVVQPQTLRTRLLLVHRRRQRVLDAGADQADQQFAVGRRRVGLGQGGRHSESGRSTRGAAKYEPSGSLEPSPLTREVDRMLIGVSVSR